MKRDTVKDIIRDMSSAEKKQKNSETWVRPRHRIIRNITAPGTRLWLKLKCGLTADPYKEEGKRPYLVLFNHQTPYDQFFVSLSFHAAVYYVATEDIFSNGWISSLIRWLVAPIPIRKMTMDIRTIRNIMQVVKEGGTVAVAPEGNRTYSGKTEYINPSIAHLAKMIHLPIALYRIEGGYGVEPRWSDATRKGKIHAFVSRVIEPEEYDNLSKEELYEEIRKGLGVNEAKADALFRSRKKAEYLERAAYVCPFCGLSVFQSQGNEAECLSCHRKITYHEDKTLSGNGFDFPFRFFNDWYEYQNAFINQLDVLSCADNRIFLDQADLSEVIVYKRKNLLRKGAGLCLYGDRIVIDEGTERQWVMPFDEVSAAAVLGRNKLCIYHEDHIYQFKGGKRFNALKYVNLYYRYKNQISGDTDGKFLGL